MTEHLTLDTVVGRSSAGTAPDLICEGSLSRTLDAIDAAVFENRELSPSERERTAAWIAARQGLPGAKSGTFAGFDLELREGVLAFTGERFTHASARHILGEEACRVLRSLNSSDASVQAALERADAGLTSAVAHAEHDTRHGNNPGAYCCGKCSVGMWRNLASGGLDRQEERLSRGVGQFLRSNRSGGGRWRAFPFWYTVLALTEAGVAEARNELDYAAPLLERAARRRPSPTAVHGARRHEIACRALDSL
jgi:hypothetical protein